MHGLATRPGALAGLALAVVAATAGILPIWTVEALPLVDLPQHEALVSVLRHWNDPACGFPELYELHFFNPYLLGYGLAWLFSFVGGVEIAFRILLSLVVLSIPLATARLVARTGGDPRWAWLALPFAYAAPFGWGFVNFLIAVPLVLLLLPPALRQAKAPTARGGLALGVGCALLFAAHALSQLLLMLILAAAALAALAADTALPRAAWARELSRRLWPLFLSLPVPLTWWWQSSKTDAVDQARGQYLLSLGRIAELPVLLTGIPHRGLALAVVVAAAAALGLAGARFGRDRVRWAPFAVVLALVLAAPEMAFGTAYLAPRFAIFLIPTLLLALDVAPEARRIGRSADRWRGALPLAAALALLAGIELRYFGMDRDGKGLSEIVELAPPGRRLLYLDYDRGSRFSPEPIFLHSGMRYAVDRCGVAEKSFATIQLVVRFRPGVASPLPRLLEFVPQQWKWDKHGGERFDLVLVRSRSEPSMERIAGGPERLRFLAGRGRWWLYERFRAR